MMEQSKVLREIMLVITPKAELLAAAVFILLQPIQGRLVLQTILSVNL